MLLEKVSIHTEKKFYLFIVTSFFIITCSFSVFVENCILLPKDINECVVFLCIVHVWFWFFTLLPIFLLLVLKGQFFLRTKILFQSAFIFSYKNVASKSFYKSKIHPGFSPNANAKKWNVIHVYTVRNLINNLISLSFCSQLFQQLAAQWL